MKCIHLSNKKAFFALMIGAALSALFVEKAMSLDTDIYFSNPNASQQSIKPNVLVIMDTSGSMNTIVNDGQKKSRLTHMKEALNTILDNAKNVNLGLMRFSSDPGGPILYPVTDLDAPVTNTLTTVQVPIAAGSDDAEQDLGGGTPLLNGNYLEMTRNSGNTNQIIGLRFQNVVVPRFATIKNAFIRFEADQSNDATTNPTSLTIKGHKTANPGTFTTAANDVSNRTSGANGTTATVAWTVSDWIAGNSYVTPDLTAVVQELVDQNAANDSWCGGNSMVFTFEGDGRRVAKSFENSADLAPVLVIQYVLDPARTNNSACVQKTLQVKVENGNDDAEQQVSGNSTDVVLNATELYLNSRSNKNQYVGIRFNTVPIPSGATVVDAFIDLTLRATGSGDPTVDIVGQKALTPGSFTTAKRNISDRIDTSAERTSAVSWSNIPDLPGGSTRTTITTPDLKTIVQELANQTNWAEGPMLFVFRPVSGNGYRVIEAHDRFFSDRPATLRITYQVDATTSSETVRTHLKQVVNGLVAPKYALTPIVDSLYEAGLYYRGQEVLYGKQRGPGSGDNARYTRVSHPASYAGGSVYRDPACTDDNLDSSACADELIYGTPTYISPFQAGCQSNYIILLTDGDPTVNNSEVLAESLIGAQCADPSGLDPAQIDNGKTQYENGKCAEELVKYYFDTDLSNLAEAQKVTTYTIGFGSDGSPDYLKAIAVAGGSSANGFKTASNASELTTAFQEIIGGILDDPTSFVSPSLSVNAFNKLFNRDEVYFSLFSPQQQVSWPGNVKKFKLCADSTNQTCTFGDVLDSAGQEAINNDSKIKLTARSIWSTATDGPTVRRGGAGEHVPTSATRKVYTYNSTTDVPASPVDLTTGVHVIDVANTAITKDMLGDAAMTDTRREEIIRWMRGENMKGELDEDGAVPADRWKFADALHSRPLTLTYGGTDAAPVIKIFVGTNDGGLRLIDAETGQEEWIVYIPEFLSKQSKLMDNASGTHITEWDVGLDGTPIAYAIDNNRNGIIEPGDNDKVYLFIGERRGGRSIYAFEVIPDSTLSTPGATSIGRIKPRFLWRITGGSGSYAELGQTWSRPLVARILIKCQDQTKCGDGTANADSEAKDVLIFAGGYDGTDPGLDNPGSGNVVPSGGDAMGNAIYIVDPMTGARIWWAGATGSGANLEIGAMKYAIPSDMAMVDTNHDRAVDRLYVGDTRGQIFRIDLGNQIDPSSTGDGGSNGYVFADVGCEGDTRANNCANTSHHNRRKFFFQPDVAQVRDSIYSTVSEYDLVTIASGDREDPLDKLTGAITGTDPVHNRIYAFRDFNITTGAPADSNTSTPSVWDPPSPLTDADLYDATANNLGTFSGQALQDEIDNFVKDSKGWRIDLQELNATPNWIGEKGLAKTTIFDGVLFVTTFVPSEDDGNQANSACAALAEGIGRVYAVNYLSGAPVFDFDGDGDIERQYKVGGGIPSETVIVIREGGVTTLVGTSGGAASPDVKLNLPRYQTYWYED